VKELFAELQGRFGVYRGTGRNHENQPFIGELELTALLGEKGVQIRFHAHSESDRGLVFHSEISTLAPNASGGVSLFNLNTNTPFLAEHALVSATARATHREWVFRFGDLANRHSFREEIRLDLFRDGRAGYHYSWGLPGQDYGYRSGLVMEAV